MADKKAGFWSKIKTSYSTPSFLSSIEKDGDSETDTVVHNSLVKYYMNRDGRLPTWLGVETPINYRNYGNGTAPGSGVHSPQPVRPDMVQRSASMLQDVYSRRTTHRESPSASPGPLRGGPGMQQQGHSPRPGTAPPASSERGGVDTIRNRLKRVNF